MKVTNAELVISAMGPDQYPEEALPEIALAGRSNVGKSSLINRMINRKRLARTSSTPGKTQTLNFYRINSALFFVDFPGYGFARVSKSLRAQWGKIIETYLQKREQLKLVLQIVDLRHPPTDDDCSMYGWMAYHGIPICVVATKADKIPKTKWSKHIEVIRKDLQMHPDHQLILFSSETGLGKDELWAVIHQYSNE